MNVTVSVMADSREALLTESGTVDGPLATRISGGAVTITCVDGATGEPGGAFGAVCVTSRGGPVGGATGVLGSTGDGTTVVPARRRRGGRRRRRGARAVLPAPEPPG